MTEFKCSECKIRKATMRMRVDGDSTAYVTAVDDDMLFCKVCASNHGINVIPAVYWPRKNGFYGELLLPYANIIN